MASSCVYRAFRDWADVLLVKRHDVLFFEDFSERCVAFVWKHQMEIVAGKNEQLLVFQCSVTGENKYLLNTLIIMTIYIAFI